MRGCVEILFWIWYRKTLTQGTCGNSSPFFWKEKFQRPAVVHLMYEHIKPLKSMKNEGKTLPNRNR
ncbi:hypothetical protein CGRA01v4_09142 [Colletotrichum graminicola]|nr:hypothetical protein CGRA01v4_09142 [Colletotrichum graminicola]